MHGNGDVHGRGFVVGACMAGVHVWQGSVHDRGACVEGGMHGRGMCGGGGGMRAGKWPLKRVLRILLECILVLYCFGAEPDIDEKTG